MSQQVPPADITKQPIVYQIPAMEDVKVRRDIQYQSPSPDALTMDVYYPPDFQSGTRLPAVVFVFGYPDSGFQSMFGCRLKDMASYTSWARLVAASGMVAVTYANTEPERDIRALLDYIRANGAALGIDENKLAIWACSGNVPLALCVLMGDGNREWLKCAVLCYGLTLDLDGFTAVADAAKQWSFANPCAGKSVDDLPSEVPLFLVRAGRDQFAGLNDAMDRLVGKALGRNIPLTYVNHASGPHAFDIFDDSETSRQIIGQILGFMRLHLCGPATR